MKSKNWPNKPTEDELKDPIIAILSKIIDGLESEQKSVTLAVEEVGTLKSYLGEDWFTILGFKEPWFKHLRRL